jgi:hypothetical protein
VGILPTVNPGCAITHFPAQCQSPNLLGCHSPLPHCPPSDFVVCHSPNLLGCQSPLPHCQSAIDACPTRIPHFCPTHYPALCPSHFVPCPTQHPHPCPSFAPSPCAPSPPPLLCPRTPWQQHCFTLPFCPTEVCSPLPQCFHPPITVNNQQCVASGGGPGCPVLPGQPVEGPQVNPVGAPIQAFGAGPGAGLQPPTLAACPVSVAQACFTPNCQTPVWQCQIPPTPFHVGCISLPIQCFTPHCPPTPLHGPCQSLPHICFTPRCQTPVWHCPPPPTPLCPTLPHICFSPLPQCLVSPVCPPPPSPAPHICFSPLPQCQVGTPFCPVSPPCPVSPLCPHTVDCPVSPNCPPASLGCPFGPGGGGGGGPQF